MNVKPAVRRKIEQAGIIPNDFRIVYPRLHYCPDWDFLLINDDEPEFESCNCYYHDGRHWYFPPDEEKTIEEPSNAP